MTNTYDRMNPALADILSRLEDYSHINYGTDAYPLSTVEAKILINRIKQLELDLMYFITEGID